MGFEEFAAARLPALLRYAYMLCGDRELSRDMTQEVLARALVKWRRIEGMDRPDAYVRTMLTNEFLSLRRRKAVATVALTYEALDGPAAPTADDPAHAVGERADLWQRLGALPRRQRAVIVLRYYEDLSDAEIADALGCRPSTVRGYAARALATLRVELSQEPDDPLAGSAPVLAVRDGDGR
ncbi:SigE family RNA polymerase sigma factor [Yinghuangia soli]|uniref:SigE family RNA polymerase sigma factor n=1 Tax=Yinghuangia soli TaxID=2908204 RepID=A0AA41U120_9ACTN|nr:SigE family RNA polymerase sigma factor [Yinghuangia soli]MCF2525689.1 SigE family RNA polymerase sigma factor [Yinghuangia soli]